MSDKELSARRGVIGDRISRSQTVTLKRGMNFKYSPFAFTEHGALMLASVLNSKRAVEVSVFVVRAFVRLREMLSSHRELAKKVAELERKSKGHDEQIRSLVGAIRQLMTPDEKKAKKIGFGAA